MNEVPRAVVNILKLESTDKDPTRCKRWVQVKGPVKRFLVDVIQVGRVMCAVNVEYGVDLAWLVCTLG